VRSILEHAWAEIEHEVVYKSGIEFPVLVKRRFARIAGAIEVLEDEFVALRDHQQQLIDRCKDRYANALDHGAAIDSVRLVAVLERERPKSLGWRAAAKRGTHQHSDKTV
jgi:putative GTP pyrophosphokinase